MKRLSFLVVTLGMLVACGGPQQEEAAKPLAAGPTAGSTQGKRTSSGDVSFDVPVAEIKGVVYEPEALGRPGVPLVEPKRKLGQDKAAIEKQRGLVQSTKDPVAKQAQAAILATMLYKNSKAEKAQEKALLTDARQVLRDVAQQVGDKAVDELTFRMLGSYEIFLEDYPAAEKAWQALIDRDPKAKDVADSRTWLAYTQLKQFKNAAALATVGGEKLDDKQPELAYVTAWAKLRTGDGAGAWQAITTASRGWGQNNHEVLEHEVLWFAGRAGVPHDQAEPAVAVLVKGKPAAQQQPQQYDLLARLGLVSYTLAGQWADAVAALDKAVQVAGDTVPANDRPVIRYSQADFTVRLDAPDAAAKFAKQALDALKACGDKCTAKERTEMVQNVYLMGRLFHILYATANDQRYYQPAHDLYELTLPQLDPAGSAQAQQDLKKLETTLKNTKAGTGTHDKGALGALLARHNLEVEACYEAALGTNPKLGGNLVVNLESDATGTIKGVSTEPKAGAADLAAVAGCVATRAKQWKLPKRGMPGNTRIKLSYALSIKQ